jgi:UPF0042 nucleotide-binding protein
MEVVILTGMSGAGKSFSAKCLEDMGYFCVDNLPPPMVPEMIHAFAQGGKAGVSIDKLAFVVDIRSVDMFQGLIPALQKVFDTGILCTLIFLEADTAELISRYKQTRRNHPLAKDTSLPDAIEEERRRLLPLKSYATEVIDTSRLSPSELRDRLHRILIHDEMAAGCRFSSSRSGSSTGCLPIRISCWMCGLYQIRSTSGNSGC